MKQANIISRTEPPRAKKRLGRLFWLAVAVCVAFGCAPLQRRLIYFPPRFNAAKADAMGHAANLERWTNSVGASIGWKRLTPERPARGRILLCYGNGSSAIGCAPYANAIQSVAAFDVFLLEYPGYGDRRGSPSEKSLFQSADEGLPLLGTNLPVYLVGESLGTGVASYLAGTYPERVAGVILLSPFNSLTDVGQHHAPILPVHLLLVDRFPSEDYLRRYHGPVGFMLDGKDRVVPEKFGMRLYDSYGGPKRVWEFPRGGHVVIPEPREKFWREVVEFWQSH
jgi:pimeloyl-ACP methyl ester carboxylesterase